MSNLLKNETSPYLLQHAENPVHWYPWGEEAFQKAKKEDKPIFLSIGYSTCHWCHVMAHESFEDEKTAELLNRHFASYRGGRRSERGFLDDYAFYIAALTELYRTTFETEYLERAARLCKEAERRFADKEKGGYYLCEKENTELFMNPKETYDGAIPSGNSVMMYNLVSLYQLTEQEEYDTLLLRQMKYMERQAAEYPAGHSMYLLAKLLYENPPEHITVVLKEEEERERLWGKLPFLANVTVVSDSIKYPLMNEKTTYYVCKNHTCLAPTNEL